MKTLRSKMLVRFGGLLTVLLLLLGAVAYWQTSRSVESLVRSLSSEILAARSSEMAKTIGGYMRDVQSIAAHPAVRDGNAESTAAVMDTFLSCIGGGDYEMLFFADPSGRYTTTHGETGSVADRPYFKAVVADGAPLHVSPPLVSRASGEHVFVVAAPVPGADGRPAGMIGATVMLDTLSSIAAAIEIGRGGFGYVVGGDGLLIAHPNRDLRLKLNLLDSASVGFSGLDEIGRRMVAGESGFAEYLRPDGTPYVAVFHPITNAPGWTLGLAIRRDVALAPARESLRANVVLMGGIVLAVLLVVSIVSGGIAKPIRALAAAAERVGAGDLDQTISLRTGDEIETLANALHRMQDDLKDHIRTLQATTAEKERIEHDLHVANRIQTSMLPRSFPPYPDVDNLDLFAVMQPAREVGGDFYDFFLVDDRRICFCVGDVSGKGVGAALFMVIARTILRNQALSGLPLAEVVRRTNVLLCAENEESMFVTLFIGLLDVRTGELETVCAGHNPPLISRAGGPFEFFRCPAGTIVGGIDDAVCPTVRSRLAPGDLLLLYTDGVNEAMNERGELLGDDRMLAAASAAAGRNARDTIRAMRAAIDGFVRGTPASDDVTLLAIALLPPPANPRTTPCCNTPSTPTAPS